MTVLIKGDVYPFTISHRSKRRVFIRFRNGQFLVSAPKGTQPSWIEQQLQSIGHQLIEKANLVPKAYNENGMYILGNWVAKDFLKTMLQLPIKEEVDFRSLSFLRALNLWFLPQLKNRVLNWQKTLRIVRHYQVRIRTMQTRLGSNSRKTFRLTFATKLVHYAWSSIDAVIVHELIHDQHFDHSPRFYAALRKAFPQYDQAHAKILKGHYQ